MFIVLAILTAVLPACESETSTNCYWDASQTGNSLGSSFVDIGGKVYDSNVSDTPEKHSSLRSESV